MKIDALPTAHMAIEQAHASMNAAFNALSVDRTDATIPADAKLAHGYVTEAKNALTPAAGHDGPDDAAAAARFVLPRLEHALTLLDQLGTSHDPRLVAPLLDELGIAMDHVEELLGAVGWE